MISRLLEMVMRLCAESPKPHYAVLDFDGTLILHDCFEALLAYMARHGSKGAREAFEVYYAMIDARDKRGAYRFGASLLDGLPVREVKDLVVGAMVEEGTTIGGTALFGRPIAKGIALRDNVVRLMRDLQAGGVEVWIVSASPEIVVRTTMKYFGLKANVIGIRNVVDGGIVTGELQEPTPTFEGKVICIQKHISATVKPLLAVGDSENDLPMLMYAQLKAVIYSDTKFLTTASGLGCSIIP